MDCAYCGKSAFLDNDPQKLFCETCRKMFLEDEIYLGARKLMQIEGEKTLKNNLQKMEEQNEQIRRMENFQ